MHGFAEEIAKGFVGPYEIVSTLSEGRYGTTYKAKDTIADVFVVIKTLQLTPAETKGLSQEILAKFRQAARKIGSIHHSSIVPLLEVGETDNNVPYIVRGFLEGQSLRHYISANAPLSPKETVHFLAQIADALDLAAQNDVVHGDLKPRKIIIDESKRACLVDVGIHDVVKNVLQIRRDYFSAPMYVAPEHIREENIKTSADVFSLAIVGFEMLTAYRPFPGSDFAKVVTSIVHNEPLSFNDVGVQLPSSLEKVFRKALSKDNSQRYSTALEFIYDMADSLGLTIDGSGVIGENILPEVAIEVATTQEADQSEIADSINTEKAELLEEAKEVQINEAPSDVEVQPGKSYTKFVLIALGFCLILLGYQLSLPVGDTPPPTSSLQTVGDVSPSEKPKKDVDNNHYAVMLDGELGEKLLKAESLEIGDLEKLINEAGNRNNEAFTNLFRGFLRHSDYRIRIAALKALSVKHHFERPGSIQAIILRLGDTDYLVRGYAVKVIEINRHPLAMSALKHFRDTEKNPTVISLMDAVLSSDSKPEIKS